MAAIESLQAQITRVNPLQKGMIAAPELWVSATGNPQTIFDGNNNQPGLQEIWIQNCGTTAVKVCLNDDVSTNKFTLVLPACTANDDGKSAAVRFDSKIGISKVSIMSDGGAFRVTSSKILNHNQAIR